MCFVTKAVTSSCKFPLNDLLAGRSRKCYLPNTFSEDRYHDQPIVVLAHQRRAANGSKNQHDLLQAGTVQTVLWYFRPLHHAGDRPAGRANVRLIMSSSPPDYDAARHCHEGHNDAQHHVAPPQHLPDQQSGEIHSLQEGGPGRLEQGEKTTLVEISGGSRCHPGQDQAGERRDDGAPAGGTPPPVQT